MSEIVTPPQQAPLPAGPVLPPLLPRQFRLWPAVLIVIGQLLIIFVPTLVAPESMTAFVARFWGPVIGFAALGIHWLFFSRVSWADRIVVTFAFFIVAAVTALLSHRSMNFALVMYGLPVATTVAVLWLLVSGMLTWRTRKFGLLVSFLLVGVGCTLVRFEGADGSLSSDFGFRWTPTPEDTFLAEKEEEKSGASGLLGKPVTLQKGDWPGFRGRDRDSRAAGARIAADWSNLPRELWRQRVGPGWSSFAVVDGRLYTQEQRGKNEVVVCYEADTGKEVWEHRDETRFEEAVAGAGPRATPTFHEGRIYALGANGVLNCLDAATGKRLWERDVAKDADARVPTWGFSASPLVTSGIVSVFAGGEKGAVLGYKMESGDLAWSAGKGGVSYCSTQLSTVAGVPQLLVATGDGLLSIEPASGKVLWEHEWSMDKGMARVIQPAVVGGSDVLVGTWMDLGTRRLHVEQDNGKWTATEVWTTKAIKPYYNDVVLHKGHLYGFSGQFFLCVDLESGEKKWSSRGHANGQVLLLPDQDLLVVLSEKGEVALLEANPEKYVSKGRFKALKDKTWNHPVVAHGKLFVRNGVEMACFDVAEK